MSANTIQSVSVVRAIKPKDVFGQPKAFMKAFDEDAEGLTLDGQRATLGHLLCKVTGVRIVEKTAPDGEIQTHRALEGEFEAIPVRKDRPIARSDMAFLPDHVQATIANQLKRNGTSTGNPNGAEMIECAFVVGIQSARRSSAGFIWEYALRGEAQAVDPMARLRALALGHDVPEPETAALAAPVAPTPALESVGQDAGQEGASEGQEGDGEVSALTARRGKK